MGETVQFRRNHNNKPVLSDDDKLSLVRTIVLSRTLTRTEKLILIGLVSHANESGDVRASTPELQVFASARDRDAITAALKTLAKDQVLVNLASNGQKRRYNLVPEHIVEQIQLAYVARQSRLEKADGKIPPGGEKQEGKPPLVGDKPVGKIPPGQDQSASATQAPHIDSPATKDFPSGRVISEEEETRLRALLILANTRLRELGAIVDDFRVQHPKLTGSISLGSVNMGAHMRGLSPLWSEVKTKQLAIGWIEADKSPHNVAATLDRVFREEALKQQAEAARRQIVEANITPSRPKSKIESDGGARLDEALAIKRRVLIDLQREQEGGP